MRKRVLNTIGIVIALLFVCYLIFSAITIFQEKEVISENNNLIISIVGNQAKAGEETISLADLNQDGQVNLQDIQLCVNVILGTETNSVIISRADVNKDGNVNILDVQTIANAIQLISEFSILEEYNKCGLNGCTINIPSGNYVVEQLDIEKPNVHIICEDKNTTLKLADGTQGGMFRIFADNITIEGCKLDGNADNTDLSWDTHDRGTGIITVEDGDYVKILNNEFYLILGSEEGNAVSFSGDSTNGVVENNYMYGGRNGVWTYYDNVISNNTMEGPSHLCVMFRMGKRNIIQGNRCLNSGAGISSTANSEEYPVRDNIITDNYIAHSYNGGGIGLAAGFNNIITNNIIYDTQYDAIRLHGSSYNIIEGNSISDVGKIKPGQLAGISIASGRDVPSMHSQNNIIRNNIFKDSTGNITQYAIRIWQNINNNHIISNNTIQDGITPYNQYVNTLYPPSEIRSIIYDQQLLFLRGNGDSNYAFDSSAYGAQGILNNGAHIGDNSIILDGENDFVLIKHKDHLNPTNKLTVLGWIKINSYPSSSWDHIVSKSTDGTNGYTVQYNSEGLLSANVHGTTDSYLSGGAGKIPLNEWTFFTITYDGEYIKGFINGFETGSDDSSGNIAISDADLHIGVRSWARGSTFSDADIKGLMIFNRALPLSEIRWIHFFEGTEVCDGIDNDYDGEVDEGCE